MLARSEISYTKVGKLEEDKPKVVGGIRSLPEPKDGTLPAGLVHCRRRLRISGSVSERIHT